MINSISSFVILVYAIKALVQPINFFESNLPVILSSTLNNTIYEYSRENPEPPDFVQALAADDSLFNIWYGISQSFGHLGHPQPWVNILGELTDISGIESLSYTLNGSTPVALTFLKDGRRIINDGDFNIDLLSSDLLDGQNTVVITATKDDGSTESEIVQVNYTGGTVWPIPYTIDWSTIPNDEEIQNVAQVVDGKWTITPAGLRTVEPGYDRLVAIGDRTWRDYEVTVPITIHSKTSQYYGVGVLVRWDGHTDDPVICDQPKCGWLPLGDIGWVTNNEFGFFNGGTIYFIWEPDVLYMIKMRVETTGTDTTYRVKIWEPGEEVEPDDWDRTRTNSNSPLNGSLLLLAYNADVTFGDVSIVPIYTSTNKIWLPLIIN
ncbi:MAG: hypothetical protein ACK2TW_01310 [Anaerolineales bacterium]